MVRGYKKEEYLEANKQEVFQSIEKMLVETLSHLYPQKKITVKDLSGFQKETSKGTFKIFELDKDNCAKYGIVKGNKKMITELNVNDDGKRTEVSYFEYAETTGWFSRKMLFFRMLINRKAYKLKANIVFDAIKYNLTHS